MPPSKKATITIDGVELTVSNLDKVFYPTGFTKGNVIDYYIRMAPALLPHLRNRPLTMKRYPDGATAKFFYQKNCPDHRPAWLQTAPIWSGHNDDYVDFCLANDLPSLVWAANLAALELHTSLSLSSQPLIPTQLVFDLDPGPPATIIECCHVALWLKEIFASQNLKSFPKTSGSKGLQIYVPLNTSIDYSQTKTYAHTLAQWLEKEHPQAVVSKMAKKLRTGKVFVDWSQNDDHKTTICVYSLRARNTPAVSTPVTWDEVKRAASTRNAAILHFEAPQVLERLAALGDIFAPVLQLQQELPALKKKN